jgi:N6-adenosine-specific RNA methylase IME4
VHDHDKAIAFPGQEPAEASDGEPATGPRGDEARPSSITSDTKRDAARLADLLDRVNHTKIRGGRRAEALWEAQGIWDRLPSSVRSSIETQRGFNESFGERGFSPLAARVMEHSERLVQRAIRQWDSLIPDARLAWRDGTINGEHVKVLVGGPRSAQKAALAALMGRHGPTESGASGTAPTADREEDAEKRSRATKNEGHGEFVVVIADPPWPFGDPLRQSKVRRGAADQYAVLTIEEFAALPIQSVATNSAVCCLWVPASLLAEGLRVLKAWGFAQKQAWVWVKTTKGGAMNEDGSPRLTCGMGRLARGAAEFLLVGVRGDRPSELYNQVEDRSIRNVFFAPATPHSRKPEVVQDALEKMFPGVPKLELFARRDRPGWTCIGNEAPDTHGQDIRDSLRDLAEQMIPDE